jgi:uncharacterized protein (DUF849 family)
MTIEERIQPSVRFKPELASLNMGSMNFGLFPMLNRFKDFKHDWEPQYLESTRDLVFRNTFKDVEFAMTALSAAGTRFEFECYDVGHLYNLAHFVDRNLVKPPFLVQTVFGILGGIGTHPEDVMLMRRTADRLFGTDYRWSILGAGRMQMPIAAMAAAMGAHCASGWRTVYGSAGAGSRAATPSRSATSAASSRASVSRRRRRKRHARFWI